jgi:hypothetical protein
METTRQRMCAECGSELRQIQLVPFGFEQSGTRGAPFGYAEWDAPRHWYASTVKPVGHIEHWLCGTCGRVFLFASPAEASAEMTPAELPSGRGDEPSPAP